MSLNESSFPGHAQKERERIEEDRKYHLEIFGRYCPYCNSGEFDCEKAFNQHVDKCRRKNEINKIPSTVDRFKTTNGIWAEFPSYTRDDWKSEVMNGDTNLGYWEWVKHELESDEIEYVINTDGG